MKTPDYQQPKAPKPIDLIHQFVSVFSVKIDGKLTHRVVTVPHTQNPQADRAEAWKTIRHLFPEGGKAEVRRVSGAIRSVPRDGNPLVVLPKGATVRQLFPDGSEHEAARYVGTVMFNEYPCEVILRYVRARSVVSVMLREFGTNTTIRMSEVFSAGIAATELEKQLKKVLGGVARDLHLVVEVQK